MLEQLPPRTVGRHEPLHALAGEDLTRVDGALRIDGDHVKPVKLAAAITHAAHLTDDLAVLAVQEPDVIVREIRDEQVLLLLVGRERDATGGTPHARHRREDELLQELAFLRRDVDAVRVAIRGVHEAVVGKVQRQVTAELLRHRSARRVRAVGVIGGDLRQLVTIRTPTPFERKRVHVEHHHASAEVVVGDVHLAGGFVEPDFFDASHDHRRRGRIPGTKGRDGCRPCGVRLVAAPAPAGRCQESCDRARAAAARNAGGTSATTLTTAAALPVRRARHLADKFAALRIIFADGVLSQVDEPFGVHVHAVPLRRVERPDDVAVFVDVDHRWRPDAAVRNRRSELCLELNICQVVRTVVHPDVVVLVDGQARDASHLPLVRQRLGPVGIVFVAGGGLRLDSIARVGDQEHDAGQQRKHHADFRIDFHHVTSPSARGFGAGV